MIQIIIDTSGWAGMEEGEKPQTTHPDPTRPYLGRVFILAYDDLFQQVYQPYYRQSLEV